ncbi:hypothetical protein NDU88_005014 [Pleurodeles waltl]|uniref:Uncharacterized protein n=1 Tax=Pleurodeles waltl TaxID=8319 RepID=A0AAV7WXC3_PLEWA|nr:hypothetical protein NDU88_005014 [Pleurodeles waltl]
MPTGADAAGNNPVLQTWPANPQGLMASKEEPGGWYAGSKRGIKMVDAEKKRAAATVHGRTGRRKKMDSRRREVGRRGRNSGSPGGAK